MHFLESKLFILHTNFTEGDPIDSTLSVVQAMALHETGDTPLPESVSEWVIKFNSLFGTLDIGVHVVHTSHVIITYTLESLMIQIYTYE